ncbi:hypothetical protein CHCC5025_1190 [Bacillus licheniformis]|nr:hypothetical protein [Bacillus subtilis]TWJ48188.1 hypothetical protein CHCC5025_1190 [Bacillus licheniformis]TWJ82621.1 hypothetical protein CHCC20497_2091 [Bacillus paralicheniformis]ASK26225.1 hypothetical protein BSSX_p0034 [Bacillus subtilis]TWK70874.1 hypothetical protein CHCC20342_2541 [Bacillus licheniformis]TWM95786.1 hypothetical protein CHCC14596_4289 [Bacillus licheniformis]
MHKFANNLIKKFLKNEAKARRIFDWVLKIGNALWLITKFFSE